MFQNEYKNPARTILASASTASTFPEHLVHRSSLENDFHWDEFGAKRPAPPALLQLLHRFHWGRITQFAVHRFHDVARNFNLHGTPLQHATIRSPIRYCTNRYSTPFLWFFWDVMRNVFILRLHMSLQSDSSGSRHNYCSVDCSLFLRRVRGAHASRSSGLRHSGRLRRILDPDEDGRCYGADDRSVHRFSSAGSPQRRSLQVARPDAPPPQDQKADQVGSHQTKTEEKTRRPSADRRRPHRWPNTPHLLSHWSTRSTQSAPNIDLIAISFARFNLLANTTRICTCSDWSCYLILLWMRSRIIHIQVETAEAVAQETTPAEEVNETLFGVNVQVRTYDHVFDAGLTFSLQSI